MSTGNEVAEPIVRGTWATAKQAWSDLFIWKHRVVVTNDLGESHTELQTPEKLRNPFSLFMLLSAKDFLYFFVGFFAWTADAFDFHALSIQTTKLADYYDTTKTDITSAITLTLLLRSIGAAIFGLLGDRFGRKWPMVANMTILGKAFSLSGLGCPNSRRSKEEKAMICDGITLEFERENQNTNKHLGFLQIATIYSTTFQQFLAVRSLFGLFMGGVYGNAVAMALENCQ